MPAPSTRTSEADERFFLALENGHPVNAACAMAGYARRCVYRWRNLDRQFAARWKDARVIACDLLAEEADRRGRDGFDEPVFYRGEQCGVKHRYSDNLLLARLKALQPE
ncbi:MAG: terminase, partial [Micropepsaceae bacterium]